MPMASPAAVRDRLLDLHKALVDAERRDHEKTLGRLSDGEFLDALIKDPAFAWLGALTGLIVHLDELIADDNPTLRSAWQDHAKRIRGLLAAQPPGTAQVTEFHRRYADFLQRAPEVVVAHGALMRELK
jgi:hypothetical protein